MEGLVRHTPLIVLALLVLLPDPDGPFESRSSREEIKKAILFAAYLPDTTSAHSRPKLRKSMHQLLARVLLYRVGCHELFHVRRVPFELFPAPLWGDITIGLHALQRSTGGYFGQGASDETFLSERAGRHNPFRAPSGLSRGIREVVAPIEYLKDRRACPRERHCDVEERVYRGGQKIHGTLQKSLLGAESPQHPLGQPTFESFTLLCRDPKSLPTVIPLEEPKLVLGMYAIP